MIFLGGPSGTFGTFAEAYSTDKMLDFFLVLSKRWGYLSKLIVPWESCHENGIFRDIVRARGKRGQFHPNERNNSSEGN